MNSKLRTLPITLYVEHKLGLLALTFLALDEWRHI